MIPLKKESVRLLKKCLKRQNPDLLHVLEKNENDFNEEIYNNLREIVCSELLENGFRNEQPNEYGIELENLIDELGRLFM